MSWRQKMKNAASSHHAQKIMAFKRIHTDFKAILKHEKCRTCSCFYGDVLNSIYEKIRGFRKIESDHRLAEIENDFERWIKEANFLKVHG
jgi:23S rRNA U2552 (ribose-2'-O)-methylase RlmE/FtsJ